MRYRILACIGLFLVCFQSVNAQKRTSIEKTKELVAQDMMNGRYVHALPLLHELDSLEPNNALINYDLGLCYYYAHIKTKSYVYFTRAEKYGSTEADLFFYLGRSYHLKHKFDQAIQYYESARVNANPAMLEAIEKYVNQCLYGKSLVENAYALELENIGENINTEYSEYVPHVVQDEEIIYFTSRRPTTTGKRKIDPHTQDYYEDIYVSVKKNGVWQSAENLGYPVNTKHNEATLALSEDGKDMLIYRSEDKLLTYPGKIYETTLNDQGQWNEPVELHENINRGGYEPSAALAKNGRVMVLSSDRPGGMGGLDLYISKKNDEGEWSDPINMGPQINTEGDEDAAHVHQNGKLLFFSSNGHETMGGFDVFYSELDSLSGKWFPPENMGYPINTADDDLFFVWAADSSKGYLSSYREEGIGDMDIYVAYRPLHQKDYVAIGGIINDSITTAGVSATIAVTDVETGKSIGVFKTDPASGHYSIPVKQGKKYLIHVESEGFLVKEVEIQVDKKWRYFEINEKIELKPFEKKDLLASYDVEPDSIGYLGKALALKEGSKIIFRDILFDFDKASIQEESQPALERVLGIMLDHKEIMIELSGHTDNIGREGYNKRLSRRRAKSVAKYLRKHGVEKKRLAAVGFGESKPIATNDSPEGRQLNRRTEVKVTSVSKVEAYGDELINLDEPDEQTWLKTRLIQKRGYIKGEILPYSIHFPFRHYDYITDYSKGRMALVVKILEENPDMRIRIHSHADQVGMEKDNKFISDERAKTVVNFLIEKGIDKNRIEVASYGSEKPLITSMDTQESVRNRRVEFEIIGL